MSQAVQPSTTVKLTSRDAVEWIKSITMPGGTR